MTPGREESKAFQAVKAWAQRQTAQSNLSAEERKAEKKEKCVNTLPSSDLTLFAPSERNDMQTVPGPSITEKTGSFPGPPKKRAFPS